MPLVSHRAGPTALNPLCRESRLGLWCRNCGVALDRALTTKNVIMGFPCCGWTPTEPDTTRLLAVIRLTQAA